MGAHLRVQIILVGRVGRVQHLGHVPEPFDYLVDLPTVVYDAPFDVSQPAFGLHPPLAGAGHPGGDLTGIAAGVESGVVGRHPPVTVLDGASGGLDGGQVSLAALSLFEGLHGLPQVAWGEDPADPRTEFGQMWSSRTYTVRG
ncbi:hypothetical protein AB0K60_19650 [Thermopolyspora sp. NPDC052614]|uniref:hypothetical protein n=1 Tax=Thermopolyspora sp. NPDC052614 TaxID=3155682 RepID=UPI00342CBE1F